MRVVPLAVPGGYICSMGPAVKKATFIFYPDRGGTEQLAGERGSDRRELWPPESALSWGHVGTVPPELTCRCTVGLVSRPGPLFCRIP